jgi:outer membrane protein TolC
MYRIASMRRTLIVVGLAFAPCPGAFAQAPSPPLNLTLQDAMERARANSPQILSANLATLIAREDTVQAKAALLPGVGASSQYIYTQPNGTSSGVFVANDGPHIYNNQLAVHGDLYAPSKLADYRKTQLAEAIARAKAEIAGRGLVATVVQNYYGMVAAARKLSNAQQSQREAAQFLDITQKQELGGEVAHADTVKAQIQFVQRERDTQEARLALDKARLGFAVFLFPDFRQDFTVVDDLDTARTLPDFIEIQTLAGRNSPDIRAAQATVQQQGFEIKSARALLLPSLSFDYFYGMNSSEFALHNRDGQLNVGSAAQAELTIPLWSWGAARSRVKQAEFRLQQAKNDLTLTQRQLLSNLNTFYLEADASGFQIASLRRSMELSTESLRLTLLRYQAGEVSVLEVVDAQTTLVQARSAYDDGMVRYRVALANLQTLTGTF